MHVAVHAAHLPWAVLVHPVIQLQIPPAIDQSTKYLRLRGTSAPIKYLRAGIAQYILMERLPTYIYLHTSSSSERKTNLHAWNVAKCDHLFTANHLNTGIPWPITGKDMQCKQHSSACRVYSCIKCGVLHVQFLFGLFLTLFFSSMFLWGWGFFPWTWVGRMS